MNLAGLVSLLTQGAPRTAASVMPPAPEHRLHTAQQRTGGWNWPEDVLQFYRECDGTTRTPEGVVLPGLRPLSLTEVVERWQILLESHYLDREVCSQHDELFYAQLAANPPDEALALQRRSAGDPSVRFIAPFLPIAEDQSGSFLVVDRRRGMRNGCVSLLDKVDGTFGAYCWEDLGQLVDAVRDSLVAQTPVSGTRLAPRMSGGKVTWRTVSP